MAANARGFGVGINVILSAEEDERNATAFLVEPLFQFKARNPASDIDPESGNRTSGDGKTKNSAGDLKAVTCVPARRSSRCTERLTLASSYQGYIQ
jgi:hypothetical protein